MTSGHCNFSETKLKAVIDASTRAEASDALVGAVTPGGSAWNKTHKELQWMLAQGMRWLVCTRKHYFTRIIMCVHRVIIRARAKRAHLRKKNDPSISCTHLTTGVA